MRADCLREEPTMLRIAIILISLATLDAAAAEDTPSKEQIAWIKNHAVSFKTPRARSGLEDLAPLENIIGDARIVALGEGTHGTREFFQMKHRLVEFMASEMDFTIFSIEANMPEAYRLNDYVLTGKGNPKELIAGMYFWTWYTQEVLDMVLWMREFNKSGKGRIEFTGFDMQTPDIAMEIVEDFVRRVEPEHHDEVKASYAQARAFQKPEPGGDFGIVSGKFPVDVVKGKRIRYSGYIKTDGISRGYAGLWWRVDGESGVLTLDNMNARGARGTTPWTQYEIDMTIPPEATGLVFGMLMPGNGTAWFDSLAVEIDGQPYRGERPFDFDFEDFDIDNVSRGGDAYDIQVDSAAAHRGRRSLRIKHTGTEKQSIAPVRAARICRNVLDRLESRTKQYSKIVPEKDVAWALQNARIALQSCRLFAGPSSRDESMAENVRWILDQAPPNAKIVLWAHNGHIMKCADAEGEYQPMGSYLKRVYGDELVVIGFTCNTGKYTAVIRGEGVQSGNDLVPAEPGSAEFCFHQTGRPRFILDLRSASKSDSASAWLTEPTQFRSIGSLAMEDQFSQITLPLAFDALVYFDETTASRLLFK